MALEVDSIIEKEFDSSKGEENQEDGAVAAAPEVDESNSGKVGTRA